MGDGNNIIITIGNFSPFAPEQQDAKEKHDEESPRQYDRRENGANLYNRQWRESSASDLRNSLLFLLSGADEILPQHETNHSGNSNFGNSQAQNGESPQQKLSPDLVNKTLDELIKTADQHEDFAKFSDKPENFWDNVRQMSDVKIVEKYIDGKLEPQAASRYGEILEKFTRQGGQMETFIKSLPPNEREVFQARYLLNQTFGADELFVGKGIALDKSGQFPVRDFLANNGKQVDAQLNTILGFLGGKLSEGTAAASLFANGQLLLNAKTAALLSLSLALYQNINSKLPLTEALPELMPQNLLGKTNENGAMRLVENNLDGAKVNLDRRSGETLIAAALINGALVIADERGKSTRASVNRWAGAGDETMIGNVFSAGATGAMLGAVIGCIVPLAEANVGTALGFAASVVVGTSERGLRYLSANLLISDVITSGVQTMLNATANLLLPEKDESQDQLKQQLFNNRTLAYLTS